MKAFRHLRSLSGILIVCFFISSVLSSPIAAIHFCNSVIGTILGVKAANASKANAGLFDEERSGEERFEDVDGEKSDRFQAGHYFICLVTIPTSPSISESQHYFFHHAPRSCGNVTDFPRYLSQRTLLI